MGARSAHAARRDQNASQPPTVTGQGKRSGQPRHRHRGHRGRHRHGGHLGRGHGGGDRSERRGHVKPSEVLLAEPTLDDPPHVLTRVGQLDGGAVSADLAGRSSRELESVAVGLGDDEHDVLHVHRGLPVLQDRERDLERRTGDHRRQRVDHGDRPPAGSHGSTRGNRDERGGDDHEQGDPTSHARYDTAARSPVPGIGPRSPPTIGI